MRYAAQLRAVVTRTRSLLAVILTGAIILLVFLVSSGLPNRRLREVNRALDSLSICINSSEFEELVCIEESTGPFGTQGFSTIRAKISEPKIAAIEAQIKIFREENSSSKSRIQVPITVDFGTILDSSNSTASIVLYSSESSQSGAVIRVSKELEIIEVTRWW